jgi:spore coat protein A, manganese oxidase
MAVPKLDGQPLAYFTANGTKGPDYQTYYNYSANSAVSHYENDNIPGTYYYHDHVLSITRLNVLAGLKGLYEIYSAVPAA